MVIIRPNGIDKDFNYQLFKYLKKDFETFTTGSAQPQLPIRDLKKMSFLLPPTPRTKSHCLSPFQSRRQNRPAPPPEQNP